LVRQFLLTNFVPPAELHETAQNSGNQSKNLTFRVNLDGIQKSMTSVCGFLPESDIQPNPLPSLSIYGTKTNYVVPGRDFQLFKRYFENINLVGLDAGHWVHFGTGKTCFAPLSSCL
jgi:hypothetical protein